MADPRLVDYVRHGLKSGISIEHMEKALIKEGWRKQDIDEAIDVIVDEREKDIIPEHQAPTAYKTKVPELMGGEEAPGQPRQPQGEPGKPPESTPEPGSKAMGVFSKFKMILRHPGKFFQAVKAEKGYEAPVKYYLFLLFIQIIIANAILYLSLTFGAAFFEPSLINPLLGMFAITTVNNFLFANIVLVLNIVFVFIAAWFFNIFIRLFKGRGRMVDTFKGIVYAYTPNVILTIIIIPIYLLILFSLIESFSAGTLFSMDILTLAPLEMTFAILSFVFVIWTLYLELKGLSIFHEISMLKVFVALIVGGVVLSIIISVVFGLFFAFFFLGMFAMP